MSKWSSYKKFQLITESFRDFVKEGEAPPVEEGFLGYGEPQGFMGTGLGAKAETPVQHHASLLADIDRKLGKETRERLVKALIKQLESAPADILNNLNLSLRSNHYDYMRAMSWRERQSQKPSRGGAFGGEGPSVHPLSDEERAQWKAIEKTVLQLLRATKGAYKMVTGKPEVQPPSAAAPRALLAVALDQMGFDPAPPWEGDPEYEEAAASRRN